MGTDRKDSALPIVVKLAYPVEQGKEVIATLTADRRLQVGDMRGMAPPNLTMDDQILLASRWFGVPPNAISKLDMVDWAAVQRVMEPFFEPFQKIGEKQ